MRQCHKFRIWKVLTLACFALVAVGLSPDGLRAQEEPSYDDDSDTALYVGVAVVALVAVYWFLLRDNMSSEIDLTPSVEPATGPDLAPVAGPALPARSWPELPKVELPEKLRW